MKDQIRKLVFAHVKQEAAEWLERVSGPLTDAGQLYPAFAQVPRKVGKAVLSQTPPADNGLMPPGSESRFDHWTIDRLCRVYLLAAYTNPDEEQYCKTVEGLFTAADMNELVALYSALPVLAYPDRWKKRCAEGIRSNLGNVLEAIMYHNPYPAAYLEQPGWNQLILKAFFTDKQLALIDGLQERNNRELALTLLDYVHERWAAGRTVNPMIWLLIGQFAEEAFLKDFDTVLSGPDPAAKQFLAEGIALSPFEPAKRLLNNF
ncbi:MAG: EboA domain-containing protein [Williamsia sp.]|nr:EboA domain-containing protein [Williamsia sp.]